MPISSNLCPSIAPFKKLTEERSGNFKLASPPTSSLLCPKAAAPLISASAAAPPNFAALKRRPSPPKRDPPFASQVFINDPPSKVRVQGRHRSLESLPAHQFDRTPFASSAGGANVRRSFYSSRYQAGICTTEHAESVRLLDPPAEPRVLSARADKRKVYNTSAIPGSNAAARQRFSSICGAWLEATRPEHTG